MTDKSQAPGKTAEAPHGSDVPRPVESSETDRLRREADEAQDRALRALAELENYRKRARRELDDERRFANQNLLHDLLPVVDNVGRAIEAAEKSPEAAAVTAGFKMVAQQLEQILARYHCTVIPALHEPFDPHRHQAIAQQPSAEWPAGTVLLVAQQGYQLHDRVLRPSQVIVSTGSAG
ncbi:MAG TPA: nucleotide exchange factor GrpE [Pirellulales bacterium]|jgi:molecular chaperone GrpE|nr:nucleotide exchange factor GrpE [Pirellulales bacterium]